MFTLVFLAGFLPALLLGPLLIPLLRRLKVGQSIRDAGPSAHLAKSGTPTMGGILFLAAFLVPVAVWARQDLSAWLAVALILGFGLMGFADDFLKVVWRRSLGLKARHKLALGALLALAFALWTVRELGVGTAVLLPFGLGTWDLGVWFYPFAVLVVLSTTNAVNLTDGLDGLAAGTVIVVLGFYAVLAAQMGAIGLVVLSLGLAGALGGFLYYNVHPARLFMGDTGALALGAAIAALAILTRAELVLPVVGGIFVLEALSDIIQVASFRLRGKRVFRMAPLHHHFELGGLSERQVVVRFWVAGLLLAALGFMVFA